MRPVLPIACLITKYIHFLALTHWSWHYCLKYSLIYGSSKPLFPKASFIFIEWAWCQWNVVFCSFLEAVIGAVATSHSHSHRIWAASGTYTTAHGNTRSLTHWARTEIEPVSSWMPVRFVNCWATMGSPFPCCFNTVSLSLIFAILITMCFNVFLFGLILFGLCYSFHSFYFGVCVFVFLGLQPWHVVYGSSQARDQIGAVANGLLHSHSHAGSEPRLRPTPQLTTRPDP